MKKKKCHVHALGGTITHRVRMVIRRIATRGTVIHRTVTTMVRIAIPTMGGTIHGLGTATAPMDTHTIGDRTRRSKPYRLD